MAKRKPDPETQNLQLIDVPSEVIHFVTKRAKVYYDKRVRGRPDFWEKRDELRYFDELTKTEKKKAISDYFCKLVYVATDKASIHGLEYERQQYKEDQQAKTEAWDKKFN